MTGYLSREQLKEMDRKQLQALAKEMGVSAAGKNEEIIERIAAVEVKAEDEGRQDATDTQEGEQTVTGQQDGTQTATTVQNDTQETTTAQGDEAAGVKVIVTEVFRDKTNGKRREVDEVIKVTKERAAELIAAGVAVRG